MPAAESPLPQAGGIVMRRDGKRMSVLLVRAKKDPTLWIFPKGHIEFGEKAEETAVRETREEAGVDGELLGAVGKPLEFDNGRERVRVQYFLMRAKSERPSPEGRAKRWFPVEDAVKEVRYSEARRLLALAEAIGRERL